MPTYVALLRAINVGGRNQVPMVRLRDLLTSLGHERVSTYLQSGNVVLDARARTAAKVSTELETAISKELGLEVVVIVRTAAEMRAVVEANPYGAHARDHRAVHVTFLAGPGRRAGLDAVDPARFAPDEFTLHGREVYLHSPGGYGKTKLNLTFFEKQLGVPGTARNWKTVTHLADAAAAQAKG